MSADYWVSSQRAHWQFTKDQLNSLRTKIIIWEKQKIVNNTLYVRYDTNMRLYIHQLIAKLGRRLMLRQIVLSTAEVYITRFLTRVSLIEINIYMLIATSIYLSCKICECPQHIRTILSESRNCWPEFISGDFTKLAEFEFYLIEELDCDLIIYHPYNSLKQLVEVLGKESDSNKDVLKDNEGQRNIKYRLDLTDAEIENTWQVINDSYITDLPLLYPPHIIAIAALQLSLIVRMDNSEFANKYNENSIKKSMKNISNPNMDPLISFMFDGNTNNNSRINQSHSPIKGTKNAKFGNNEEASLMNNLNKSINKQIPQTNQSQGVIYGSNNNNNNNNNNNSSSNNNNNQMGLRRKLSHSISQTRSGRSTNINMNTNMNTSVSTSPEKITLSSTPTTTTTAINYNNSRGGNNRIDAFTNFLAGSNVNLEEVIDSVQELLTLYEAWQFYDEGTIRQNVKLLLMALNNSNIH
jgi:cyclin C